MAAARASKKSFTSKNKKTEPIVFDIDGTEFTALPSVIGAILLDYIEETADMNNAQSIREYLKLSMTEEEYTRFDEFTRVPENDIDLETLSDIMGFLIEAQTSRPTSAS